MWVLLGILSSGFLGLHEIFKKAALHRNAVLPVLLLGTAAGASLFIPFLILSRVSPELAGNWGFYIPPAGLTAHLMFAVKSAIVSMAWLFGYFAVKHLPVTLLAPLNASGPVWTMLGAMAIYSEKLNAIQWAGVLLSLGFYFALSFGGGKLGVERKNRRWVLFAFLGIIFNSISALFDKYLVREYDRIAMQSWFSIYTTLIFLLIIALVWYPNRRKAAPFSWRWAIPLIGVFLVVADFFYFKALSVEGSLVSVLIIIRRASSVLVFVAGAIYFKETNLRRRGILLAGILMGVMLIVWGSL
jgi:transporter family protein